MSVEVTIRYATTVDSLADGDLLDGDEGCPVTGLLDLDGVIGKRVADALQRRGLYRVLDERGVQSRRSDELLALVDRQLLVVGDRDLVAAVDAE